VFVDNFFRVLSYRAREKNMIVGQVIFIRIIGGYGKNKRQNIGKIAKEVPADSTNDKN